MDSIEVHETLSPSAEFPRFYLTYIVTIGVLISDSFALSALSLASVRSGVINTDCAQVGSNTFSIYDYFVIFFFSFKELTVISTIKFLRGLSNRGGQLYQVQSLYSNGFGE